MTVIETHDLGKRYGHTWALRHCDLRIQKGSVVALVGPNGAGKTTLLNLLVGLGGPTMGSIAIFGSQLPGSTEALQRIAFVAQDAPLYKFLTVAETLQLARKLNGRWDDERAISRLEELRIPLDKKVGKLSGGQVSQVALTLAIARRPDLLVLDEPLARLDPLARHDFMATMMGLVADEGLSVVLSSHVITDLERVADYLVVVDNGEVRLAGGIDELLSAHRMLMGPVIGQERLATHFAPVHAVCGEKQAHVLVRDRDAYPQVPDGWQSGPVNLEELVLAYLRQPSRSSEPDPRFPRTIRSVTVA